MTTASQLEDLNIATFSVVGRSADGKQLGVAVASRFLAVGSYVPAANLFGAVASQANTNMKFRDEGLAMLERGVSAGEALQRFFEADPGKGKRQAGIVDAMGNAATFTGDDCPAWAGGQAASHPNGSYAVQGNILAGPEVINAMVTAWCDAAADVAFAWRLLSVLEAGQTAGGDSRGKQAAALYVIEAGKGYGGMSDVAADLRCDDSPEPIAELCRLLTLHDELFPK